MLATLIGLGGAALLGTAGYQSMAPTGQWYGRTFIGLAPESKQIALTYDDGPNDPHTLRLLEVLAKHGASATFFLIGRFVAERPDIAREIVQAGHTIGNHTFTHPRLIFASPRQTHSQLQRCTRALEDAVGVRPTLFRPPYGGRRPDTLGVARSMGMAPIMWTITGFDWNAPPAEQIFRRVSGKIRGGDVVLLHDGNDVAMGGDRSQTVIATDRLIERHKADGHAFVTIPQMMGKAAVGS